MDTLIQKIKDVEKEARNVILDAESESIRLLDEARFQANSKLEKVKTKAHSTYIQSLKNEIDKANQKKEEMLNKKIQDFYDGLNNIDDKKRIIIENLKDKIKNWIK